MVLSMKLIETVNMTKYYNIQTSRRYTKNKQCYSHVKTMVNQTFEKRKFVVSLHYNDLWTGGLMFCATTLVLDRASTHRQCAQRRTTCGLTLHLWY